MTLLTLLALMDLSGILAALIKFDSLRGCLDHFLLESLDHSDRRQLIVTGRAGAARRRSVLLVSLLSLTAWFSHPIVPGTTTTHLLVFAKFDWRHITCLDWNMLSLD